jgi:hypothetical protein
MEISHTLETGIDNLGWFLRPLTASEITMSQYELGAGQRRRQRRRAGPWAQLRLIPLVALAACGSSGDDGPASVGTLAYVVIRCSEDAGAFVFGPDTLQIRRGDRDPVTVMEIPASTPEPPIVGVCRVLGLGRHGPGAVSSFAALTRVAVSPDGSAVVFEVTDEFSRSPRNLSSDRKQIFFVNADGSGLRPLGPASRVESGGNWQGFRFNPDGGRVVFNDRGPDHAGHEASQVVLLDIATGERTQLTRLSPGPRGTVGSICCPRFVDNETIAFGTTLDPDGLHPKGGVFTVRTDGKDLKAVPLPVVLPGSRIETNFVITGDQPAAATYVLAGTAVNPHDGFNEIRETFLVDGTNLLQLTNFRRVDTHHVLLGVDRQSVFFAASANPLGTNPAENCQVFSVDVFGANLRQLTDFSEGPHSAKGCQFGILGARKPLGCYVSRLFQDPVTQTVAFFSSCDPLGSNPNGTQVFSVRPDGTGLRQLTNLREIKTEADGTFRAELLGPFAYPGVGSSFSD